MRGAGEGTAGQSAVATADGGPRQPANAARGGSEAAAGGGGGGGALALAMRRRSPSVIHSGGLRPLLPAITAGVKAAAKAAVML